MEQGLKLVHDRPNGVTCHFKLPIYEKYKVMDFLVDHENALTRLYPHFLSMIAREGLALVLG